MFDDIREECQGVLDTTFVFVSNFRQVGGSPLDILICNCHIKTEIMLM